MCKMPVKTVLSWLQIDILLDCILNEQNDLYSGYREDLKNLWLNEKKKLNSCINWRYFPSRTEGSCKN